MRNIRNGDTHFYLPDSLIPRSEREPSGYKYRVAPGTAITSNGVKDTPVQSQSERSNPVAGKEDGSVKTTVGVKLPWSGLQAAA